MQQLDGVAHVGRQTGTEFGELLHHAVDMQCLAAQRSDLGVVGRGRSPHGCGECVGVEHIAGADADAAGLVGIGRPNALQRGADLVVAASGFVQRVERLVPREDEVGLMADLQLRTADAAALEGVDLAEQRGQIDHHSVADDGDDVRVQHATGDELQRVPLGAHHHGVAGVVAALVAHHVGVFGSEKVDDLGLAFVTPLGAYDNGDGHGNAPQRMNGT